MFIKIFGLLNISFVIFIYPQSQSIPILTLESLLNCTYPLGEGFIDIKLENGKYHLLEKGDLFSFDAWHHLHISCELNNDSLIDAIFVLGTRDGTGHWQYIFPVINNDGIPVPLKPFELLDRQNVQKIYKRNNFIFVEVLVHSINDPLDDPSIKETWKFKFQEDRFIQID